MAVVKYDVSEVEAGGDFDPVKPGLHDAKIAECNHREREPNDDLEVIYEVTKGDDKGRKVWDYVPLVDEDAPSAFRLRQFTDALGLKPKGSLNPGKLVGKPVKIKTYIRKSEEFGDSAKVRIVLAAKDADEGDGDEDYAEWELQDLKDEVEEREVEVSGRATKKKLIAALETDDAGEAEEDEDEDEDGDEDYESMDVDDLKELVEEREVEVSGRATKKKLIAALEEDDEEGDDKEDEDEDDEGDEDYTEWDLDDLREECKERGLPSKGRKAILVKRLEKYDETEEDPFE